MEVDNEAALGLIKHLNSEELRALMDDDSRLNEIIADSPMVSDWIFISVAGNLFFLINLN